MRFGTGLLIAAFAATACKDGPTAPDQVTAVSAPLQSQQVAEDRHDKQDTPKPNYNLNIVLRGDRWSSGYVKFRQPGKDAVPTVYLHVRVRHLAPNTSYLFQRATDNTPLDGICTGTNWLTLGNANASPPILIVPIVTDKRGNGSARLVRQLPDPASLPNPSFDITFRVIRQDNQAVVLTSKCYQFTIRG